MTKKKLKLPKPEDILLEISLKTLNGMDSNLAHSENAMIDAIASLRLTRKWILKIQKNDIRKTMISNEERVTALEEDMQEIIQTLKKANASLRQDIAALSIERTKERKSKKGAKSKD